MQNAFDKQVTFQALRQTARELRGRAQADPLAQSASLLEAAIAQLDKVDGEVDRGQDLQRQNDRLQNQVQVLEGRRAELQQEIQNLESQIADLQEKTAHWKRAERDAMIERMAENQFAR